MQADRKNEQKCDETNWTNQKRVEERKTDNEKERGKDKEEWIKMKKKLKRLETLGEEKDKEKRRNNIIIREVNKWGENKMNRK